MSLSESELKWWAGPILRRRTSEHQAIFWALDQELDLEIISFASGKEPKVWEQKIQCLKVTEKLFFYFADVKLESKQRTHYDIVIKGKSPSDAESLIAPLDVGKGEGYRPLLGANRTKNILFGSCRKMSFKKEDAFLQAARQYHSGLLDPDLIAMVGDQVYSDDLGKREIQWIKRGLKVLGFEKKREYSFGPHNTPMVLAIEEYYTLKNPWVKSTVEWDRSDMAKKFGLSTETGSNQLFLLSEWIVYYLLHWSPTLINEIKSLWNVDENLYFESPQLDLVRKMMANVPVLMTTDDHDVTDDWNINPLWVKGLSPGGDLLCQKAEMGLFIFQDWGNEPQRYLPEFWENFQNQIHKTLLGEIPDKMVWDFSFTLEWGNQFIVAPDLRHFRTGPQELSKNGNANTPAGLMDPQRLKDVFSVVPSNINRLIFISGTPVYGFDLIEGLQRLAYFLSKFLRTQFFKKVLIKFDIENWRADPHEGTYSWESYHTLIREFYRVNARQTLILSGDVHYSFVKGGCLKEALLEGEKGLETVWQINSSAFHNSPDFKSFAGLSRAFNYLFSWKPSKGGIRPKMLSHKRKSIFPDVNFGWVELAQEFKVKIYCVDSEEIKVREFQSGA